LVELGGLGRNGAVAVSEAVESASRKKLLVVEDEVEIGRLIARVAEEAGYSVTVLTDSTEFKEVFKEFKPSVVTIDILMPEVDGIELIQWIGQRESEVPIVIISGADPLYTDIAKLLASARGAHQVLYLPKPLDLRALTRMLSPRI